MKIETYTTTHTRFVSEVHPEICGEAKDDEEVLAWADANPDAFTVVRGAKSKAWGRNSSHYLGCIQGREDARGVVDRLATLMRYAEEDDANSFFHWSARFSIAHVTHKGFTGGFFQLWDGTYDRSCAYLDYTPKTLEAVTARFEAWCDKAYEKVAIKLDGKLLVGSDGRVVLPAKAKKTGTR